ncbi:Centlein [Dissostichus eleginoides]|uniref:Centlein n=1 Tax=Dissostichus eleginoides TaxID=100907 RepID=A0AAD9BM03_DISEL|nr:Centlein [Dissostichus eleginoides]
MLDKLCSRVTEAEDRIGMAEDQLVDLDSRVVKLRKENDFLMESLVKRRKEYDRVKTELRSKDIPFALLHPATLRITLPDGGRRFFQTPKEAAAFLRETPAGT